MGCYVSIFIVQTSLYLCSCQFELISFFFPYIQTSRSKYCLCVCVYTSVSIHVCVCVWRDLALYMRPLSAKGAGYSRMLNTLHS